MCRLLKLLFKAIETKRQIPGHISIYLLEMNKDSGHCNSNYKDFPVKIAIQIPPRV